MVRLVELPTSHAATGSPVPWHHGPATFWRDYWAVLLALGAIAVMLLFPMPLSEKLRAILHGLCAQRLSHTYLMGDHLLPFDARMTGIYGGFLISFVLLVAAGRARAWAMLTWPVLMVLIGFVALMGVDGLNSTLLDLGLWHAYPPRNDLRLVTGALTGVALAVLMVFLLATTLWRFGDRHQAVVGRPRELGLLVAAQVPFVLAVWSGFGLLYAPLALLLLTAAVTALAVMALAGVTILRHRDLSYRHWRDLQPAVLAAIVIALVVIGALAAGRFALEAWLAIPVWL